MLNPFPAPRRLPAAGIAPLLALLIAALASPAVHGCVDYAPAPPPPIWVTFRSATSVEILIHDYTTFGATPGQFCACGLNLVGPILSVDSAAILDSRTGLPVPGWSFVFDQTTSDDFSFLSGQDFAGFASAVTQTIPPGLAVDIRFLVTVLPGTLFADLAAALDAAPSVSGTDEANADGSLTQNHLKLLPAGNIMDGTPCQGALSTAAPRGPVRTGVRPGISLKWPGRDTRAPGNNRGGNLLGDCSGAEFCCRFTLGESCDATPGNYSGGQTICVNGYWDETVTAPVGDWVVTWTSALIVGANLIPVFFNEPISFGPIPDPGDYTFCIAYGLTLPVPPGSAMVQHGQMATTPGGCLPPAVINSFTVNP